MVATMGRINGAVLLFLSNYVCTRIVADRIGDAPLGMEVLSVDAHVLDPK